jgi:hypothetical protein
VSTSRPGYQAEEAEHPLLRVGEVAVGQCERGGDAAFAVVEVPRLLLGVGEPVHQVAGLPGRLVAQPGGDDPDGQREPAAQVGDAFDGIVLADHPVGTGDPTEQRDGVGGGQGLQRQRVGIVECGQPAAAGDQDEAAGRCR